MSSRQFPHSAGDFNLSCFLSAVIKPLDYFGDPDEYFLVLEKPQGAQSLTEAVFAAGRFDEKTALDVFKKVSF